MCRIAVFLIPPLASSGWPSASPGWPCSPPRSLLALPCVLGGWGFFCCSSSPIRSCGRFPVGLGSSNKMPCHTHQRLSQWLGHAFRMPPTRMPRKVLASWIPCSRPVGRPHLSNGHSILKDLAQVQLRGNTWGYVANSRRRWRALTAALKWKWSSSRTLRGCRRQCNSPLSLSFDNDNGGGGAPVTPPPPPPYPDGGLPTQPANMAHNPHKFWFAQAHSALCDCGHAIKDQLHRYFHSGLDSIRNRDLLQFTGSRVWYLLLLSIADNLIG